MGLRPEYEVKSNRESGYGRYDVMVIPRDLNQTGIIIEFKKVDVDEGEDLEKAAERALQQIEAKKYQQDLLDRGIHKIIMHGSQICHAVGYRLTIPLNKTDILYLTRHSFRTMCFDNNRIQYYLFLCDRMSYVSPQEKKKLERNR